MGQSSTMTKITWITAAEIEANLAATMAEVMRKQQEWLDEWPALYERMYREGIAEFLAKYERDRAELWARWKPPKPNLSPNPVQTVPVVTASRLG
jgi:hypothetical protein